MALSAGQIRRLKKNTGLSREQIVALHEKGRLSRNEINELSPAGAEMLLRKKEIPNRPIARMAFGAVGLRDDDGELKDGARARAHRQLQTMHVFAGSRDQASGLPTGAVAMPPQHTPVGTTAGLHHDNSGWTALGPNKVGGRTRDIVVDPADTDVMWAASASGGVWRTDDGGKSWYPTEDLMANMAISALARNPSSDPRFGGQLFAGTGEGFIDFQDAAVRGEGIFKSADGFSWQLLDDTRGLSWVNSLAFSHDGATLLVVTNDGVLVSTDGEHERYARATLDQGDFAAIGCVACHPTDASQAVAGGRQDSTAYHSEDGGQTWRAATPPPGWADGSDLIPDSAGTAAEVQKMRRKLAESRQGQRIQLCYARKDPKIVYGMIQDRDGVTTSLDFQNRLVVRPGDVTTRIWRSRDGGASFTAPLSSANILGTQGWYANVIWAGDPTDENLVVAGGLDLYRSTDGGDSFTAITEWRMALAGTAAKPRLAPRPGVVPVHADQHAIVADPGYDGAGNKRVFFGNDGGMFATADVTAVTPTLKTAAGGWDTLNHGYAVTQYYSGAGDPASRVVIAGAQDNGTNSHTPGNVLWDRQGPWVGDGGSCAYDASNRVWYGQYPMLSIFRSTRSIDAGGAVSWQTDFLTRPSDPRRGWVNPLKLDPEHSSVVYVAGSMVWRTTNGLAHTVRWIPLNVNALARGSGWSRTNAFVYQRGTGFNVATILTLDVAAGSGGVDPGGNLSNVILAGGDCGNVWVTRDADRPAASVNPRASKPSWQAIAWDPQDRQGRFQVSGTKPNRTSACLAVAVDPANSEVYYACWGGYQAGNLWKTTDGGATWTDVSAGLPDVPVRAITFHPHGPVDDTDHTSQWLYVGTDVGVFASENAGARWSANNEGPANVAVFNFFWMGSTLVAVTHGRGLFQADLTIRDLAESLLVGDAGGRLYQIDGGDGTDRRQLQLAGGGAVTGIHVIEDTQSLKDALGNALASLVEDTAYVTDTAGYVTCVDTARLRAKWRQQAGGPLFAVPQFWIDPVDHQLLLLTATIETDGDGFLRAYDLDDPDGRLKFSVQLFDGSTAGDRIHGILIQDDWAYVTAVRGVYAARLVGVPRAVAWKNGAVTCTAPPLVAAGTVFVPAETGLLAFDTRPGDHFDPATGTQGPAWSVASSAPVRCQPVWVLGALVFGDMSGKVTGVDHKDGSRVLFAFDAAGQAIGSLAADDNRLYLAGGGTPAELRAYEVTPGAGAGAWTVDETWSGPVALAAGAHGAPAVVGDSLYLSTGDGQVHCFATADGAAKWRQPFALAAPSLHGPRAIRTQAPAGPAVPAAAPAAVGAPRPASGDLLAGLAAAADSDAHVPVSADQAEHFTPLWNDVDFLDANLEQLEAHVSRQARGEEQERELVRQVLPHFAELAHRAVEHLSDAGLEAPGTIAGQVAEDPEATASALEQRVASVADLRQLMHHLVQGTGGRRRRGAAAVRQGPPEAAPASPTGEAEAEVVEAPADP